MLGKKIKVLDKEMKCLCYVGILEIDQSKVKVIFNSRVISLPKLITIKLWDKLKVSHMIGSQPILFHLISKQGFNWFTLAQEEQEIENI